MQVVSANNLQESQLLVLQQTVRVQENARCCFHCVLRLLHNSLIGFDRRRFNIQENEGGIGRHEFGALLSLFLDLVRRQSNIPTHFQHDAHSERDIESQWTASSENENSDQSQSEKVKIDQAIRQQLFNVHAFFYTRWIMKCMLSTESPLTLCNLIRDTKCDLS